LDLFGWIDGDLHTSDVVAKTSHASVSQRIGMSKPLERFAGMSVLIVDDNPSNVALLEALLDEQGLFRIYTETDPRQVPRQLAQNDPDLVLLDLHMPGVDGHEVLTQIKLYAAGSFLPVLVLTADTTTTARDRALGEGAQDFLTKPIDSGETALRIANLLRTRQLFTTLRQARMSGARDEPASADDPQMRERILSVLRSRAITPVYQPVVDVQTLRTVGYEGLSRFPGTGYGGPDRWFGDAFEVGLGVELEWLAASKVLSFLDGDSARDSEPFLAVNMSPASVLHLLRHQLCEPGLYPKIVIELTEHVPVEDYAAVHGALADMRARGSRLAADDLGSGYAGFRHLIRLQPDIIKLDISLVRGIHRSNGQRALSSALVAFAADVGAHVIAEGIEEQGELDTLREIGVPWAQGYYLGKPAPLPGNPAAAVHGEE
jgi:EAL domain-containing protein (putative c-di-GMP-specific phosphodiesterase class I)/AmiR/NasT family two-component response regulator